MPDAVTLTVGAHVYVPTGFTVTGPGKASASFVRGNDAPMIGDCVVARWGAGRVEAVVSSIRVTSKGVEIGLKLNC